MRFILAAALLCLSTVAPATAQVRVERGPRPIVQETTEPDAPSTGYAVCWTDASTHFFTCKNSTGFKASYTGYGLGFGWGPLTAVSATKGGFRKIANATTVDSITASAISFTCSVNPVITMYECGTDASCASPTSIGSATLTAAGAAVDGTVSSAAIGAGHYVAFALSAGTCTALNASVSVQVH